MTTELDALSESVREAVEEIDSGVVCRSPAWETIRAELIRLTARVQELERENGECRRNERDAIRRIAEQRERAETSERRLERSVQDIAEWRPRALTAEAERDAIKKRIADAPKTTAYADGDDGLTIGCGPHILACMDESEIGECFAIVKLEDGE